MSKTNFYSDCYSKTGWLPMNPLAHGLAVGDVAQIRQGRFQALLNIVDAHLTERVICCSMPLDGLAWRFGHAVQQTFCQTRQTDREDGEQPARTRQVLEFAQAGGFLFHADALSASLLTNWHQIRDDVTLKLTQLHYSFREVYVVTGVVSAKQWALVVAGQAGARLEMSAAIGSTDCYTLLSHSSAHAEQCHSIAGYEKAHGQAAHFFKAKKLVISDAMYDRYLAQVLENQAQLRPREVSAWLDASLLNLVKSNEMNLNTSISFFSWVDLTLDDVALLTG